MAADDRERYWRNEALKARAEMRRLQSAHELLLHRDWFAFHIDAGLPADDEGRVTLFVCDRQGTRALMCFGPRDVVLVGRYTEEPEREAAVAALAGDEGGAGG